MIVENMGYLKLKDVLEMEHFSIYATSKKLQILVKDTSNEKLTLYYPRMDRLPWKMVEGKRICNATKIFDSKIDSKENVDVSKWNNKNQIIGYKAYSAY